MRCGDTVMDADLVMAADGTGSAVRGQLFPAHPGPVHAVPDRPEGRRFADPRG